MFLSDPSIHAKKYAMNKITLLVRRCSGFCPPLGIAWEAGKEKQTNI